MGRTPGFERDRALDSAMKLFWQRGYTATSLQDLLDTMGIARSSFYSSFTDKRTLFLECLQRFGERTRDILNEAAAEQPPLAAIHQFFQETALNAPPQRVARGCLMVNTLLELADTEPELQAEAQAQLNLMQREFEHQLAAAMDRGELRGEHSPTQLAEVLMTLNLGIRVQSRKLTSRRALRDNINNSLALLGIPA